MADNNPEPKLPNVTISGEEAHRILNLMRNVQMNLGHAMNNTHPVEREANLLFSNELAGELNELINGLEGSIWESGMPQIPHDTGTAELKALLGKIDPNQLN